MAQALKMIFKVFLLLTGGVMLLGGGICAAMDTYFAVTNGFRADSGFILMFAVVSALIAWAGWWVIQLSGILKGSRSGSESDTDGEEQKTREEQQ
jgi:hypothetical protein